MPQGQRVWLPPGVRGRRRCRNAADTRQGGGLRPARRRHPGGRGAVVNSRTVLAAILTAAFAAAACSSTGTEPQDPSVQEDPPDSTPVPDATEDAAEGLEALYTQSLEWDECGEQQLCSTLDVPLDYDEPAGQQIEITVLRVPATGDDPIGSLIVNPGGPGASGVEYARNAHAAASEQVRERFDIVGFDPRGVGQSVPVDCLDDEQLDEFVAQDMSAEDDESLAELEASMEQFIQGCEDRSGDLLPHIGTDNVARDMDILRSALGDEELTYLGKSYGTFVGAVYADLFPDRVGRMVLDGAVDPLLDSAEVALGQAEGFQEAFDAFLDWCLEQDCPLGTSEEEARDNLDEFISGLEDNPLPTDDEQRPLTGPLAFQGIILPLYLATDEGYPTLLSALDAAINDDDGSVLLQLADLYLNRTPEGQYEGNQNEAIIAVNCLDRPTDVTVDEAREMAEEFEDASPIFGQFMAWGDLACDEWPVESDYDRTQISGTGADPILVLGTTGDPATPFEWAESLAEQLDSATLLTYDAFVHTAYLSGSDCVDDTVDEYLLEGTPPEEDLVCT
ncbi:alpha/beta hydrolase [Actinobacteria bacterium YIM 96077]|uniref:Alpha/beta hydrolase n=1 Tax=Phytoactinopolyspora halophila TaxID=1981511 RepID=A0A329QZT2_9ACTN|nr:alpha/beta hydrolase [Actinobacteria bacterium YIM 96077]RAW17850.1 alpha/beta hydrolase [Phytoactinopolyspora halophila]